MSPEKLVDELGQQITRRTFLVRMGSGAVGALLGLIGLSQTAYAYTYACCNLCFPPSSPCGLPACDRPDGNHSYSTEWCWYCTHTDGKVYKCCECKDPHSTCKQDCNGVYQSWATVTGFAPRPAG